MKKRKARMLYEKKGNKFVSVGTDEFILPFGIGDYLVRVRKGHRSIGYRATRLNVNHAKLEIVMDEAADALARAISKHSEAEPTSKPWTEKEKKAWEFYKKMAGTESLTFSTKSACEIARLAVVVLRENLKREDALKRPEGCIDVLAEKEVMVKT